MDGVGFALRVLPMILRDFEPKIQPYLPIVAKCLTILRMCSTWMKQHCTGSDLLTKRAHRAL